jgi:threonine dehydrogenase-like Zn-dependent dehydrogenase
MADTSTVTKETQEAQVGPQATDQIPQTPVFEEIAEMTEEGAINVVIQAAGMAQQTGQLTVRDSVILAKAISVLRPGSI